MSYQAIADHIMRVARGQQQAMVPNSRRVTSSVRQETESRQEMEVMSRDNRKIRFGLWYDFRNPSQWRQPYDRLYGETLDQIEWGENHGFDDVWLSEHHFIEDGYLPSILPVAAAIAARTKRIRIASGVVLMPFHNGAM
jgi:hypothetical protein